MTLNHRGARPGLRRLRSFFFSEKNERKRIFLKKGAKNFISLEDKFSADDEQNCGKDWA
jgi:hypothetical protein